MYSTSYFCIISKLGNFTKYLFERIFEWNDEGNSLDIYLDFSKAFDKVPYNRLIKKLGGYGIQENVLRWIAEWLRERKQQLQLNGHRLGWMEVRSGVLQRSVLGPLLFTIFMYLIKY